MSLRNRLSRKRRRRLNKKSKKQTIEGGLITMSETTDMINELSREDPQFAKGIQHYRQQYRYADAIEKLRKRAKLTQTQLGDLVGASQSAVARWERGDANITMKTLEKIAEATHTQLDIKFVKDSE